MKSVTKISKMKSISYTLVVYITLALLWQFAFFILTEKTSLVKAYIFPNPIGVLETFGRLISNNTLLAAILTSLRKMIIGYSISIVTGIVLGLIICTSKILCAALKPFILGLQTLPSICWIPFALLWFGLNETATIFVIVIGSTFSICISVETAIKNVNPLYIRAAKTMDVKGMLIFREIVFPASIPEVVSGFKQGWSFAWRALMAGEMIAGTMGLGYVLLIGRELLDINQVMAVMITIIVISVLIENLVFAKIENTARKRLGLNHQTK